MEEGLTLRPLMVISLLAFILPVLAARMPVIRVPVVVAEILAGMVVGGSGLDLLGDINENVWLSFLVSFGFAYLLFLSGLEVDFSVIFPRVLGNGARMRLGNPAVVGTSQFALAFALAAGFGWILTSIGLGLDIRFITLVFATTSVGIVVPTLKERGLLEGRLGQGALLAALLADFVTIFLVTLLAASYVGDDALEVAIIALLLVAFLLAFQAGALASRRPFFQRIVDELGHATTQLKVRGALALMLIFLTLSQALGAEIILGAFLAGAVVSSLSREGGSLLRSNLDAIGYGFFIPIFFIAVGARFELGTLMASREGLMLVPLFVVAAFLIKVVPALALVVSGSSLREALAFGFLLSARLTLIIAVAEVGLELGLLDPAMNSAIIVVAVLTSTGGPAIFSWLLHSTTKRETHVLLAGSGQVGGALAQRLLARGCTVALITEDLDLATEGRQAGLELLKGPITSTVIARAQIERAEAFVALTDDDDVNLRACLEIWDLNHNTQLLAVVNREERAGEFRQAGIKVLSQPMILARVLDELLAGLVSSPSSRQGNAGTGAFS